MIARNPRELEESLGEDERWLGIDVGSKTLGLALSDVTLTIATPLDTLRRRKFAGDAESLREIVERERIGGVVLGLPLNMDGSEGPRCQSVRQFARNLETRMDVPMTFWDERLSTAAVTRTLLDADASRKRRSEVVDKMAAAYILQGALDSLDRDRRRR
ncbi:MAG: Holliday junction resolvase RuvX [Alphaproteobacteria bacterium]|nr:Holliday junction resolvase RuvX [Alphaproteobacteria bacterium]MCY4497048.1 Holliday junction resolvase RuvX [Rhodospirillaceae bacterium]